MPGRPGLHACGVDAEVWGLMGSHGLQCLPYARPAQALASHPDGASCCAKASILACRAPMSLLLLLPILWHYLGW